MKKILTVLVTSLLLMACNDDNDGDKGFEGGVDIDQAESINMVNFRFSPQNFSASFVLEDDDGEMITGARDYKVMILGKGVRPSTTAFDIPWHHGELYQCGVIDDHECRGELKEVSAGHYTFNTVTKSEFAGETNLVRISVSVVGLLAQTDPKLY